MKNKQFYIYLPLFLGIALIIGIYLGINISGVSNPIINKKSVFLFNPNNVNKISEILNYIEKEYVDTIDRKKLEEKIIQDVLQELDPHSYYIPAKELQAMNEPLEGEFDGIGIEFNIRKDTIMVVSPISGGPSEILGILAGDRIIKVDTTKVAGIGIKNSDVMKLLRGKKGSKVKVEIARRKEKELLTFNITRGKIPIFSIDVSYMLTSDIGYIKLSRFSKTSHEELVAATKKLTKKGMQKLVLDLRGNGGGYLDAATKIADEFLTKKDIIVYTEGKARPKEIYYASEKGGYEALPLAVLIDENSASASEIIAGAIQDNDRGIILGRRSFGKGLVQEPSGWPDGSAIRLTIARYYTPTGRCIQKPYNKGTKQYHEDFYKRYENGELLSADSIKFPDSLKYTTPKGKIVYGGGGIMPDIFVPLDTVGRSYYFSELVYRGLFRSFAFDYIDKKRDYLNSFKTLKELDRNFKINDKLFNRFIAFAEKKGIKKSKHGIKASHFLIEKNMKAHIIRDIWGNDGFYPEILKGDKVLKAATRNFNEPKESLSALQQSNVQIKKEQ